MSFYISPETQELIHYLRWRDGSEQNIPYIVGNFGNQSINLLKTLQRETALSILSVSFVQAIMSNPFSVSFTGEIISNGGREITEMGVVYAPIPMPTLEDYHYAYTPTLQVGTYVIGPSVEFGFSLSYARAYATTSAGTTYGDDIILDIQICFVEGTLITLMDGTKKPIEDITYSDELLIWDFDSGTTGMATPVWIMKKRKTLKYNLLTFSNGAVLKTVGQHRIFNREKGAFTYPMSEETPLGTTTLHELDGPVVLMSKEIVEESVDYYNVITYKHINLFASGILTSSRYNNIYPIKNMKFVKDSREIQHYSVFEDGGVPRSYYDGLRLGEQNYPTGDIISHVLSMHKNGQVNPTN